MSNEKTMNINKLIPWIIYLIFFAVLNETVFNVSTPMIAKQFSLSPSGVSWMMTIFMIFFGIGSVIYGRLSDLYSLRRLILVGIVIYVAGSVMGFVFQFSYPLVVAARAVQGIGGSAIPALAFVVIARYFEFSERGRIFGFITSTVSLSIGLGPVIGGFVAKSFHWSYLFLIPLLLLITIPFFSRELPKESRREGSVDIFGAVLVALTVGTLVVYLNFSEWYYLVAFIGMSALFVRHIRTAADPFIKPSLFKNIKFRSGVIVGLCLFAIVIGILFLIPLMLNNIYNLDTSQIGLLLFPGAISSVFFGPLAGSLADRRGNSFVVMIGLTLLVASLVIMSFLLSISFLIISAALLMTYVGFSMFQTALINSVSQTLPEQETGTGMGVFNLVGIISGAVGTAVVGKILARGWFDFLLLPTVTTSKGYGYSNIMLVFALIIVLGGILYLKDYRTIKPETALCLEDC
jgi:DHA2 family metal-tetracycline-proton antiporter-like MFS transporter